MEKQIKLLEMKLVNFKGIRNFTLDTSGINVNIYGDNAVGKTTLFDAFVWLLFDKDSQNKKDFQIKTVDASGKVLHGLEHEVEATFEIDGKKLTLRKVYSEKWTKQRGSAVKQFTGHTTDHYIDGVPKSKGEFVALIKDIVDEEIFKLLTSPTYFNEVLHWKDKRKILLKVAGDVTDEEVIASDESLQALSKILKERTLDDHRDVIINERSRINKELEKIPVRIDEVQRGLPDISKLNKEEIEKEISFLKLSIEGKEKQISRINNGAEISKKQKDIYEIESELLNIKNNLNAQTNEKINLKREQLNQAKGEVRDIEFRISGLKREIENNEKNIALLDKEREELRNRWHEINGREFSFDQEDTCPTCGQALPKEQLEEAREKALSKFNLEKSTELSNINETGKAKKQEDAHFKSVNQKLAEEIETIEKDLESKRGFVTHIEEEITKLSEGLKNPTESEQYQTKLLEKQQLENEIAEIKANQQSSIDKIQLQIAEEKQKLTELQQDLDQFNKQAYGKKRIEELMKQEKELAAEFERLEGELYLTEQFIRTKVEMLEEKISSKFKYARFKMFDVQVNGGISEACEALFDGVPYSSGLNNASRINVGLDIINTLSEYYGLEVPIFIDNSEAVTRLIGTKGQLIRLIVSEKDKELRVEHEELKEAI